jgi:hypothetical protein
MGISESENRQFCGSLQKKFKKLKIIHNQRTKAVLWTVI